MTSRFKVMATMAVMVCFPLASPLRACCDDFWGCVGAVATAGLSCAIESLLNLVRTLAANVGRLVTTLAGQVADVVNLARTELGNAANDIRGIASQAEADFNAAEQQAATVVTLAAKPWVKAARSSVPRPVPSAAPVPANPAPANPARVGASALAPIASTRSAGARAGIAPGAAPAAPAPSAQVAPALDLVNHEEMQVALGRAKAAIDTLRPEINAPLNQVRQFAGQAEQQVSNAVGSAAGIAERALLAPLQMLGGMLAGLLSHPERIFDPGRLVDDAINQVTSQVIGTMNQVHDAVMSQARGTLNLAHQPLQDLLDRSATAKKISDAMLNLERQRTRSAFDGLNAVVPARRLEVRALVSHTALATHASGVVALDLTKHKARIAAPYARLDAVKLTTRAVGTQMNAKLKGPWMEFKRLQVAPVKVDPSAKVKMDAEIARRFAGKTAAESAAEKRAMLAEARAHFASDPELLRKVSILIEGHPVINGRLSDREFNDRPVLIPTERPGAVAPATKR
jgi:hypothetical protein